MAVSGAAVPADFARRIARRILFDYYTGGASTPIDAFTFRVTVSGRIGVHAVGG